MGIKIGMKPNHVGGFIKRSVLSDDMTVTDATKIVAFQKLVDEGRASGISNRSMDKILADAKRRYETA